MSTRFNQRGKNLRDFLIETLPLMIYAFLFGGMKVSEHIVLTRSDNNIRRGWGDWTVWLILVPL